MIEPPAVLYPPAPYNSAGEHRRIGFEIEFAAVSAEAAAAQVCKQFGGQVHMIGPHRFRVKNTRIGDFVTELDTRFVNMELQTGEISWMRGMQEMLVTTLGDVVSTIVPCEIVTPPIAIADIPELDDLLLGSHDVSALGYRPPAPDVLNPSHHWLPMN